VNLIGEHTDYTGGLVFPMAIDRFTTIEFEEVAGPTELASDDTSDPDWRRYPDAVAAEMREAGLTVRNVRGHVTTTIPVGAGLSSSAALEIASALAFGHRGNPAELAQLTRRAEHRATGVPCGIMDQLVVSEATAGAALLIDCRDLATVPVRLPEGVVVHAVHSGVPRSLAGSAYAERRATCEAAAARIGPLRDASVDDLDVLPLDLRRRARHVITENLRVRAFAAALAMGDVRAAGRLMDESHRSLAEDYDVSVPALDQLCEHLRSIPGVHGARLTGAGFGGCVVALVEEDVPPALVGGWRLSPAGGATVTETTAGTA